MDLEVGSDPENQAVVQEVAEKHQSEQSPLVWSDGQKTWTKSSNEEEGRTSRASVRSYQTAVESHFQTAAADTGKISSGEPIYVEFADDDPENPFNWSRKRKWVITIIGVLVLHM